MTERSSPATQTLNSQGKFQSQCSQKYDSMAREVLTLLCMASEKIKQYQYEILLNDLSEGA